MIKRPDYINEISKFIDTPIVNYDNNKSISSLISSIILKNVPSMMVRNQQIFPSVQQKLHKNNRHRQPFL